MECFWRLYGHWQPAGHCHQQDPAVFYVCVDIDDGLTYYHLHGAGLFPECAEICDGGEAESLVLFITPCSILSLKGVDWSTKVDPVLQHQPFF